MKERLATVPFHPFCFALYPVLLLYSVNVALIPQSDVYVPALWALAGVSAVFLLTSAILRDWRRGAFVATVAVIEVFTFQLVWKAYFIYAHGYFGVLNVDDFVRLWLPASLLPLIVVGWKRKRGTATGTMFLNVVGLILVLLPTCSIIASSLKIRAELARLRSPSIAGKSGTTGSAPPDIFYVILDGYGREDAIQHFFGYSNKPFIDALRKRGFYVADQSRSNYCQTELSLASSLNMDFIQHLAPNANQNGSDRALLDDLLDRSSVAEYLKDKGYGYEAITSGFPGVEPKSADMLVVGHHGYSLFEATLISETPLLGSPKAVYSQYASRRDNLVAALDNWESLPRGARPRFVFVHILAPHPPFVLGPNGESVMPKHTIFGYWDASAYFVVGGTHKEYHDGYLGQLEYVNKRVLEAVDRIVSQSTVPPVIILQGDHGSRQYLSQDSLAESDVRECFRNLNAYLVPDSVRSHLFPDITPVNSFRVLFNGLFNADFPLLPNTSFYTTWDQPFRPIDVTKQALVSLSVKRIEPDFTGRPQHSDEQSE